MSSPRELMPPPPSPAKQKMSRSSVQSSTSSIFRETTREKIKALVEDRCWNCGRNPVQACHVIAQQDPEVYPTAITSIVITTDEFR